MGWICQHCGAPFGDSAYRVKSEESGVVLLDIIVCQHCHLEARDLGLHTEEIGVRIALAPETTATQEKSRLCVDEQKSDGNRSVEASVVEAARN